MITKPPFFTCPDLSEHVIHDETISLVCLFVVADHMLVIVACLLELLIGAFHTLSVFEINGSLHSTDGNVETSLCLYLRHRGFHRFADNVFQRFAEIGFARIFDFERNINNHDNIPPQSNHRLAFIHCYITSIKISTFTQNIRVGPNGPTLDFIIYF